MASTSPNYNEIPEIIDVESDAGLIQKSIYKKPGFFGDASMSSGHSSFMNGVMSAALYSGMTIFKNELVNERNESTGYKLTKDEYRLLEKRARSISNYSKIPYDTCEDFLVILCFIDQIRDMRKVAEAVQIPELDNEDILRKPNVILNIDRLEKISFAASALDGIVNMYRKYLGAAQSTANNNDNTGDDMGSIFNALSSLIGGFGGASPGPRLETSEMGNFLSELITGKRIPVNVIAKNPMLQNPSYTGKAFFGELQNAMSNVDMDQLNPKKIAVFPKNSNGAGGFSFSMQNFGSFSGIMNLENFVSKVMTGSPEITSDRKRNQIAGVVQQINTLTGSKPTDKVEIMRADNAIPIMMALATSFSGTEKSIFSDATFKQGWALAQSVGSHIQQTNPSFIEAARKFL